MPSRLPCGAQRGQTGQLSYTHPSPLFTLYAALSSHSTVLGRYPAKTLATPLGDKTLVLQRGDYQVRQVHNPRIGLQPKDRLHTLLSEGEGYSSATLRLPGGKSKSVSFSFEDVELDTLAETQTQAWTQMRVGKQQG